MAEGIAELDENAEAMRMLKRPRGLCGIATHLERINRHLALFALHLVNMGVSGFGCRADTDFAPTRAIRQWPNAL
jgi:hypothetical protein